MKSEGVVHMTKVTILPIQNETGSLSYRAVAKDMQTLGRTAGEALDALTAQLPEEESGTLVVVQSLRPDRFFTEEQQERLRSLMNDWRLARDRGESLATDRQAELDALVETELRASAQRAATLANELGQ